jgi:transposase
MKDIEKTRNILKKFKPVMNKKEYQEKWLKI